MTNNEIRNLVRTHVLRLLEDPSQQVEDDVRFELKSKWPDPDFDAARKIAAHANTAHGEPFIWIIGVKERPGEVLGADLIEFSQWWAQVRSHFDERAPDPRMFTLDLEDKSIAAIYFENDPPYVVIRPEKGQVKSEVPYRVGTAAHSITRSQLFRLLLPLSRVPSLEIIGAFARLNLNGPDRRHSWRIKLTCFFVPQGNEGITIARHLISLDVLFPNGAKWTTVGDTRMDLIDAPDRSSIKSSENWKDAVTLVHPAYVIAATDVSIEPTYKPLDYTNAHFITIRGSFTPAGIDHGVPFEVTLPRVEDSSYEWRFGSMKTGPSVLFAYG